MENKEISLDIEDEEIVFADLTNRENLEVVAVCKSGNIFLVEPEKKSKTFLTKLPFNSVPNLSEDFNPLEVLENLSPAELIRLLENQPSEVESLEIIAEKNKDFVNNLTLDAKLYSFKDYICIVRNKGRTGIVLDLTNPNFYKKLERGDYQVEHCSFPIAFYEKNNQTFLIHGTDWNRLDITCLETDELLTERIVDYDTNSNYFDYFHSSLLVAPDAEHFTSNGWVWHPYDRITIYPIKDFLDSFEKSHIDVDFGDVDGYNWDRPLCWIDRHTLGIGYNKREANDGTGDFVSEIIFVDIVKNEIADRIEFDGFALSEYGATEGDLFYDRERQRFIGLNNKKGALISTIKGEKIFEDKSLTSHKYSASHRLFYRFDYKNQTVILAKLY